MRSKLSVLERWLIVPMIRNVIDGMNEAEKILKNDEKCNQIDWTTVMAGAINNKKVTGNFSEIIRES
jgi:hypothetical protein